MGQEFACEVEPPEYFPQTVFSAEKNYQIERQRYSDDR